MLWISHHSISVRQEMWKIYYSEKYPENKGAFQIYKKCEPGVACRVPQIFNGLSLFFSKYYFIQVSNSAGWIILEFLKMKTTIPTFLSIFFFFANCPVYTCVVAIHVSFYNYITSWTWVFQMLYTDERVQKNKIKFVIKFYTFLTCRNCFDF